MYLAANVLIETVDEDFVRTERVLYVDRARDALVVVDVMKEKARPRWMRLSVVQVNLDERRTRLLGHDPWLAEPRDDDRLGEAERTVRDRAWEAIEPIVSAKPEEVFEPKARGRLIERALERNVVSKPTLYKYLYRYWRGGQTIHALVPRYERSGGRGKTRTSGAGGGEKRGRPSLVQRNTGEATGINVDEHVRLLLIKIGEEFYANRTRISKRRAFEEGLKKYFHDGYEILPDGTGFPVLPPPERLPTFGQFEYWYGKIKNPDRVLLSREGQRAYDLEHRPIRGDSTAMAFGPGSMYQIDATVGNVYLVSSRDLRLIIGRPVIYVVVDVFSRLVVGFTVGLEGPSWMGAVLAFENVATDKVEFCASMGIDIAPDDWPVCHLPEAILADRGELEGGNADSLVKNFGVRVANTPPYRADWKGIVERHFRLVDERIVKWLPGAVRANVRGERDYRLDSKLTLKDLREVLAQCFLNYNKTTLIKGYPLDQHMRRDRVRPYPLQLWQWGLEHRTGGLKYFPSEVVRRQLLPRAEATVTARGLLFKGQYYACAFMEAEGWRARARQRGTWRVAVAYDPWSSGRVWMDTEGHNELLACDEIASATMSANVPWAELELEQEIDKVLDQDEEGPRRQARARYDAQIDRVLREAEDRAAAVYSTASRAERVRGIAANRREEKLAERQRGRQATDVETGEIRRPDRNVSQTDEIPVFDPSVSSSLDALVDENQKG